MDGSHGKYSATKDRIAQLEADNQDLRERLERLEAISVERLVLAAATDQVTVMTTKWVPTQVVKVVSRPAGLGPVFFLGVALLAGGIGLGISRVRKGPTGTRGEVG